MDKLTEELLTAFSIYGHDRYLYVDVTHRGTLCWEKGEQSTVGHSRLMEDRSSRLVPFLLVFLIQEEEDEEEKSTTILSNP